MSQTIRRSARAAAHCCPLISKLYELTGLIITINLSSGEW